MTSRPTNKTLSLINKQLLEVFGFLLQWTIAAVETKAAEKSSTAPAVRGRGKGAKPKTGTKDGNWDSSAQFADSFGYHVQGAEVETFKDLPDHLGKGYVHKPLH